MLSSSRFVVAVHAMSVLARFKGKGPVCSAMVAESVHTNPVVIRRLMTELEKAHLVKSVAGRAGGFELNKDPGDITLQTSILRWRTKTSSVCTRRTRSRVARLPHSWAAFSPGR